METWIAVILALTIAVYALCRIRITIGLQYRRTGRDDIVAVNVSLLKKLISYQLQVPVIKWSDKGLPWLHIDVQSTGNKEESDRADEGKGISGDFHEPDEWRFVLHDIRIFGKMYKRFIRRIENGLICEELFWRTRFGLDDPAATSMLVGLLWAVKNIVILKLKKRVKVHAKPMIMIVPSYTGACCDIEIKCIFSIRFGNVINAAFYMINFMLEGGTRQWGNTQSKV